MAEQKTKQTKKTDSSQARKTAEIPAEWAQDVLNQMTEAQKTWFEIASQQNSLMLETVGKLTEYRQTAPTDALGDWVKQGIEGFVEAQRRWSEIVVSQSEQILNAVKSGAAMPTAGANIPENLGQGAQSLVKMHESWLDFAEKQNENFVKVMKESMNWDDSSPIAAIADFSQKAIGNYIEVQKRWLDLATQLPYFGGAPDNEKK